MDPGTRAGTVTVPTNHGARTLTTLLEWFAVQSGTGAGSKRLEFVYDYLGRRVQKKVYTFNPGWVLTSTQTSVYDGWKARGAITMMTRVSLRTPVLLLLVLGSCSAARRLDQSERCAGADCQLLRTTGCDKGEGEVISGESDRPASSGRAAEPQIRITKGMSEEEVEQVLGSPTSIMVHGPGLKVARYPEHNLQVEYSSDGKVLITGEMTVRADSQRGD